MLNPTMDYFLIRQALDSPATKRYNNPPITPEMVGQVALMGLGVFLIGLVIWYFCKDK